MISIARSHAPGDDEKPSRQPSFALLDTMFVHLCLGIKDLDGLVARARRDTSSVPITSGIVLQQTGDEHQYILTIRVQNTIAHHHIIVRRLNGRCDRRCWTGL